MKKIMIAILLLGALTACATTSKVNSVSYSHYDFTILDTYGDFYTVYNNQTKVMYVVSDGYYNAGNFTLLVNPDGTPQLYTE